MALDPTTPIGKVRLRCGDYNESLPMFPDSVYQATLDDSNGSINRASRTMCYYILALMTQSSNVTLGVLSLYDADTAKAYMQYLNMVIKDSTFNGLCPIPYFGGADTPNPVVEFDETWTNNNNLRYLDEMVKNTNDTWPVL